jgi:hypothetical protein
MQVLTTNRDSRILTPLADGEDPRAVIADRPPSAVGADTPAETAAGGAHARPVRKAGAAVAEVADGVVAASEVVVEVSVANALSHSQSPEGETQGGSKK